MSGKRFEEDSPGGRDEISPTDDPPLGALDQAELDTLEAELRAALQHRDAEVARMLETQERMEKLLSRAKKLLDKTTPSSS